MASFEALLEQLATRHRRDIDAAVRSLSQENLELRQQILVLTAKADVDRASSRVTSKELVVQQQSSDKKVTATITAVEKASTVATSSHGLRAWSKATVGAAYDLGVSPSPLARHTPSPKTSSKSMEKRLDQMNRNEILKLYRRLEKILCSESNSEGGSTTRVLPENLYETLQTRKETSHYKLEEVIELLADLASVARFLWPSEAAEAENKPAESNSIEAFDFARLLLMDDLDQYMPIDTALEVYKIRDTLVTEGTEEVITRLAAGPEASGTESVNSLAMRLRRANAFQKEEPHLPRNVATVLNIVVAIAVALSLVSLGVSLDHDPDSMGWVWLELAFAIIFFCECALKCYYLSWRLYLFGRDFAFNWLDMTITLFSAIDLIVTLVAERTAFNVATVLKGLRLFRFLRLMKLLNNSPMLKQLASMLSGLMIGGPSLFWVIILLLLLIYVVAILLRSFFILKIGDSQYTPSELIARCGRGDFVERNEFDMPVDPACKLHIIYGIEFFGSVPRSMITVFRFLIGDTSTAAGRSLIEYLDTTDQQGAGWLTAPFYVFYIPLIIVVWFGVFNTITSIFVETTISGLKHCDTQNRRKRVRESRYVKSKLQELVDRIGVMVADGELGDAAEAAHMQLNEDLFVVLMSDAEVKAILLDLDVTVDETSCKFEMFDPEGIGSVSMPDFLNTLLRLRGELHKIDLVSSWSSLRKLQRNIQDLHQVVLAGMRRQPHDCQNTALTGSVGGTTAPEFICSRNGFALRPAFCSDDFDELAATCAAIQRKTAPECLLVSKKVPSSLETMHVRRCIERECTI